LKEPALEVNRPVAMDPQAFQETTKRLHDLKAKADNLKVAMFMLLLLCTCIGNLQVHANKNQRASDAEQVILISQTKTLTTLNPQR
jgi:hypothetical protein